MAKIMQMQEVKQLVSMLQREKKIRVVVGGCFDILHIGHITFLEKAKKLGDVTILLLESDANVKKLKGPNRPLFTQRVRAHALSSLSSVDYIILLPPLSSDLDYEKMTTCIKPQIIAVTAHDPLMKKKEKQALGVQGKVRVIPLVKTFSSSKLARLLEID